MIIGDSVLRRLYAGWVITSLQLMFFFWILASMLSANIGLSMLSVFSMGFSALLAIMTCVWVTSTGLDPLLEQPLSRTDLQVFLAECGGCLKASQRRAILDADLDGNDISLKSILYN